MLLTEGLNGGLEAGRVNFILNQADRMLVKGIEQGYKDLALRKPLMSFIQKLK